MSFEIITNTYLIRGISLAPHVLVIAKVNLKVKDWSAYIGALWEDSHQDNYHQVANHGSKIPYEMAKALYPDLMETYRWRD